MKRILLLLVTCGWLTASGQAPYNNEWIDYSKTYYKFKVGATGVYRIDQATLASIGLGATPAEHFQLWRNGAQVPLYTSVQAGPLGGADYLEFWGERNDGKPDNIMYRMADYQLNDRYSLQTDTAAFFLTVNAATPNLRLVPTVNDVAGNVLPAEPYFLHDAAKYYRERIGLGYAQVVGENVYSSAYDRGEGWASADIGKGATRTETLSDLFVYTGAGAPTEANFRIHASGYNGLNVRNFRVRINGDSVLGQALEYFDYVKLNTPVPVALISSGTATIAITNLYASAGTDRMIVHQFGITYPRQFNFGNASNFEFTLPANINGNYLEISNFNYGSTAPVLYDLSNGKRYVADISNPALVRIALQPSSVERKMLLVSLDPSVIYPVGPMVQRNFVNYALAANQGDYLIITHPALLTGTGGAQPVEDYKNYRSSAAGGSYNAKLYMIDELVDQFGLGIKMHPLSVRNFIRWARDTYSNPVKNVFIIGKGIQYMHYRSNESHPDINKLAFVPTFGQPASDILLAAEPGLDEIPRTPIGRLSVISADEIRPYFDKVIEYEQLLTTTSPTIADQAWRKNVAHVVGASDEGLSSVLTASMNRFSQIISDTMYGGNVHTFSKTSTEAVVLADNVRIQNLFQEGLGLITYFGHSSATTLEYNLDNPFNYNNPQKYPLFILLGCNAGNLFNFNLTRLQTKETISEKYVLAEDRGSIGAIASTHLGIVHYLDIYNTKNYTALGNTKYGATLGEVMQEAIIQVFNQQSQNDYYARFHCEQATLNGDPAIRIYPFEKPDYVIEDHLLRINPAFISIAESHFTVDAKFLNIGKAVNRNIVIEVTRTYPDNTTEVIARDTIPGIRFADSLTYRVPIVATRDKGLNKITVKLDADNEVDELYETNNSITKEFFIFEDEARPVYPYAYAIINTQNITFKASTANPFSASRQYMMELDTTELFNSPFKLSMTITSAGGVMEFNPAIVFTDSTVYYWRVAPVPDSGAPVWNASSFVYLPASDLGFNQSHYYQHLRSEQERLMLTENERIWKFDSVPHFLFAKNAIFGTATNQEGDFVVSPDGDPFIRSACVGNSLIFNIFDPLKFIPTRNLTGRYGSALPCQPSRQWNFEYSFLTQASRKLAMDFMDSIPENYIVVVRNINGSTLASGFINEWQNDTLAFGSGNSLYHKLKAVGFNEIDSFYRPRATIFMYQKNKPEFGPVSSVSAGVYDIISLYKNFKTPDTLGFITSPAFGRASEWKQLKWRGTSEPDAAQDDLVKVSLVGVRNDGSEATVVSGLSLAQQDYDISGINASEFPYLKIRMSNQDSVNFTPYQLRYWRLTYTPVPEGAIAPNLFFETRDTVELGQPVDFKIAFKNISGLPFDSMLVKLTVTNSNNITTTIPLNRYRELQPDPDTIIIHASIPTINLPGRNTLFLEVNPTNDQPEQYHFNNFAFREFYVIADSLNPLLDVTFDGVHILNRDLVSAKPEIVIKLKDESRWGILDDTSLLTIQVRYPDGSLRRFFFNNDTLQFVPAGQAPNPDNTATVNFNPYFFADGDYELMITGRDRSGNATGNIEHRVAFQVINKPMISNMLNYPNPFTTSTAFVFTITGSEVPQNIRIQIMTITGKIVRDITKDELGPLHIGRNITEFKWDGTDQYGQKLANGIYLYRVITNLNGKVLDKYKAADDNTDKYFNKGYGKMYLMR